MFQLLQSLRDVCQRDPERLDGRERVLEVQRVRVVLDAAELHHLRERKKLFYFHTKDPLLLI